MAGIASPGLGSGLDITGIVTKLMQVEQQPLVRLNQKEAQVQAEISAYGALKSSLSSLQSALDTLSDPATFQATKASSSDSGVFTTSSSTSAVASSYSVTVNRLAQQHKLGSSEFSSAATFGGAAGDEFVLTVGSDTLTVDLSTAKTLAEIQAVINVDSNETGVTAGLLTGDSGNQTLVLTSGSTGYDSRVQVSYGGAINSSSFNFSMLNRDASNVLLSSESELDSSLTVDGVSVTRGDNSVSDVVEGLTISLVAPGQANVDIALDSTVATSAMDSFVKAYNALKGQLTSLKSSGANGSFLRNVESQLRGVLNTGITGLGSYSYISELGMTTNSETGQMEFESSELSDALEKNRDSVVGFFSDTSSGFTVKLDNMLEGLIQTGGTIDDILAGAKNRVSSIERNRELMTARLESVENRYMKQFSALDALMVSMTTTSDYLGRQLDVLDSFITKK